ncbi:calponin homology domain-containing protein [Anaeramoeba flamelloides]|uniref:Calponin homology domain-containing protein n=1 Tax=Anaeramoeba flamelloides TaxID=1746091 RepID=A0AAV7Z6G7_9EUKA|nr:calponin homology domain-containing protein [Anaeramoeba flamelloides]
MSNWKRRTKQVSEREKIQETTFKNWVNLHLRKRNKILEDFATDFCNGELLMDLLQELSEQECKIKLKKSKLKFMCINNLAVAFDFLKKVQPSNRPLTNIGPEDIYSQNKKLILALVWHLIVEYQVSVTGGDDLDEEEEEEEEEEESDSDDEVSDDDSDDSESGDNDNENEKEKEKETETELGTENTGKEQETVKTELEEIENEKNEKETEIENENQDETKPETEKEQETDKNEKENEDEKKKGETETETETEKETKENQEKEKEIETVIVQEPNQNEKNTKSNLDTETKVENVSNEQGQPEEKKKVIKRNLTQRKVPVKSIFKKMSMTNIKRVQTGSQKVQRKPTKATKSKNPQHVLLEWCKNRIFEQSYLNLEKKNFVDTFSDPNVYFELLHKQLPQRLPNTLEGDQLTKVKYVFEKAEQTLDIPQLVDPQLVADKNADARSLMTYASFYRNFYIKTRKNNKIVPNRVNKFRVSKNDKKGVLLKWMPPKVKSKTEKPIEIDYYQIELEPSPKDLTHNGEYDERTDSIKTSKLSLDVSNFQEGVEYKVWIKAHNNKGYGPYTKPKTVLIGGVDLPRRVTNLKILDRQETTCQITWKPPSKKASSIDFYQVLIYNIKQNNMPSDEPTTEYECPENEVTIDEINANEGYYMKVRAHNAGGYSKNFSQIAISKFGEKGDKPIEAKVEKVTTKDNNGINVERVSEEDNNGKKAVMGTKKDVSENKIEIIKENAIPKEEKIKKLQDPMGRTELIYAILKGDHDLVQYLLKNGASPNQQDKKGMSPLHAWVLSSHIIPNILKLLLKYGANLEIEDNSGRTPLYLAVYAGKNMRCRLLYKSGASLNIDSINLLHVCLLKGKSLLDNIKSQAEEKIETN